MIFKLIVLEQIDILKILCNYWVFYQRNRKCLPKNKWGKRKRNLLNESIIKFRLIKVDGVCYSCVSDICY